MLQKIKESAEKKIPKMSLYNPKKGRKRVILEIGNSAVRLCEFKKTKTGLQLVKYYERLLPIEPNADEEQRKDSKRRAIAELLKQAKVRSRKVVVAVPGQSVFIRVRSLPPVSERKVDQIVRYEIQQQIPFDLKQIAIDYQILDHPEGGGYEVLMSAIKVDVVDKFLSVVEGLKLQPEIVDVIPFASYSWLKHIGELPSHGECVAIVDMGAATTNIVVERDGIFRNTRTLNIGGNDITQAIADTFNISFEEAERLKCEKGFAPTGNPQIDGKGGQAIGRVLNRLVNEIQRSFSYFRSLPGGGQVTRVYLCGGGCALRNIVPYLHRMLGIDVRIAQPLSNLTIGPEAQSISQHPERSCVVLGLGLRNWETTALEINLIPPRILERRRRVEQAVYWALSMVTLALIMASVIPVHAAQNKLVKHQIEELRRLVRMYDPEVAQNPNLPSPYKQQLDSARAEVEAYRQRVQKLDNVVRNRQFWLDELLLVMSARPPRTEKEGIWFSSIETVFIQPAGQGQPAVPGRPGMPPGIPGGGGGPQGPQYNIENFPGIGGGTGVMAGISAGWGGMRGPGAQQQPQGEQKIPWANGFRIFGLATSDVVIKNFVDNLKKATISLPDGLILRCSDVLFSEGSVQITGWDALYNAQTAFQGSGAGIGAPGQTPPLTVGPRQATGQTQVLTRGQNLFTFIVTVRFERVSGVTNPGGGSSS